MKKEEILMSLLKTRQRSLIVECDSKFKAKAILKKCLKTLICSFSFDDFCDNCKDCVRINKLDDNLHPDILVFNQQLFGIAEARQLKQTIQTNPMELDTRYVVFYPEKYSQEAQNAILKLLEEDTDFTANTVFIFIVKTSSILLKTIESRSVITQLESNKEREFISLVKNKGFCKPEFVATICSFKEETLNKALYIKEKFNLDVDSLQEAVNKIFQFTEITEEIFQILEPLKMFPYAFIFKAIESEVVRSKSLKNLEEFYNIFYRDNKHRSKTVKENISLIIRAFYFVNKYEEFKKYYIE